MEQLRHDIKPKFIIFHRTVTFVNNITFVNDNLYYATYICNLFYAVQISHDSFAVLARSVSSNSSAERRRSDRCYSRQWLLAVFRYVGRDWCTYHNIIGIYIDIRQWKQNKDNNLLESKYVSNIFVTFLCIHSMPFSHPSSHHSCSY